MKDLLKRIFWPILGMFETGEPAVNYKPSHRMILVVVGLLFVVLSLASAASALASGELGGLIPIVVFLGVATVVLVVGTLGSDSAVCKIWGRK